MTDLFYIDGEYFFSSEEYDEYLERRNQSYQQWLDENPGYDDDYPGFNNEK